MDIEKKDNSALENESSPPEKKDSLEENIATSNTGFQVDNSNSVPKGHDKGKKYNYNNRWIDFYNEKISLQKISKQLVIFIKVVVVILVVVLGVWLMDRADIKINKEVTVRFFDKGKLIDKIQIPINTSLKDNNKYFEPPSSTETEKFSHWERENGSKVNDDTIISDNCVLKAIYIKYVTVLFMNNNEKFNEIQIPSGTSFKELKNNKKYVAPESSTEKKDNNKSVAPESLPKEEKEKEEFSHWQMEDGSKVNDDTIIQDNCTLEASYITKCLVTFNALQEYNPNRSKKLWIEKGKNLREQCSSEELENLFQGVPHPLFQFVCWKFNNGIELIRDTPINCGCTVFAEYKIDSAVKKMYVVTKDPPPIVKSNGERGEDANKNLYHAEDLIKILYIWPTIGNNNFNDDRPTMTFYNDAGNEIKKTIETLLGIKYKDDKHIYYDGFEGTHVNPEDHQTGVDIFKYQDKLDNGILDRNEYYEVKCNENTLWITREISYYCCRNGIIKGNFYSPNKLNPKSWNRHPFCNSPGFFKDNGSPCGQGCPITKDETINAKWEFGFKEVKCRLKEKTIYLNHDISSKTKVLKDNTVTIVDVWQNPKTKEEWGKLKDQQGWIDLRNVTTILYTKDKEGKEDKTKKYILHFVVGKNNNLGDRIVATPEGKTIQQAFYYGDIEGFADPIRENYEFAGWRCDGKPLDKNTKVTEEHTEHPIIADWVRQ